MRTVYTIYGNNDISFLTLDAAEEYLMENYPEHCGHKDAFCDFAENMIEEEDIKECCFCNERETEETLTMNNRDMRSSNCGDYIWHVGCSL